MCFSCFSQFRPRYKRLVDDIFPALPQDGLVKSNMEKLTFYALSSPEKLDRIGEYLYQKASRDITRRREGYVKIAMEAMDQLLVACHSQTLNLFVESFLRIVQKLLECPEPELQILATQSFVRFANIEEDTPSYHRRYDFFVSKFSSMCHNNDQNMQLRDRIRLAGIKGLQGVIRKTVSDDLVENIWEAVHMDKIIPSLLYIMQNPQYKTEEEYLTDHADTNELLHCNDHEEKDPTALAESCFRELVGRASFGHVKSVIRPVLRHFDLHNLWVSKPFAIHCFRLIMFSIQSQYMYTVIESLMIHLDENSKLPSKIRTNVANVLSKIIAIAAGESIGPTVLEIINSLLTHLRSSVSRRNTNISDITDEDERSYQEALIVALGEFAAHLPDYQKIEIMMFIMSKIAYSKSSSNFSNIDNQIQHISLKSLLMVCSKYSSSHMTATLPHSFLDPLLRCSHAVDPEIRLLVQNVLHLLFDRHNNGPKLSKPRLDFTELNLTFEKCSRTDTIFMRKHCPELYQSLCESLEHTNNTIDNVEAVYKTMSLLCIEFTSKETFNEFFYAILALQDIALTKDLLPPVLQYQLHTIAICSLALAAHVHSIPSLQAYVDEIVEKRKNAKALHLLPELCIHYEIQAQFALPNGVLLDETSLIERLHEAGIDLTKIYLENTASIGKHNMPLAHRNSWTETYSSFSSVIDYLNSSDGNSEPTTPCLESQLSQDFTFEGMKSVLTTKHEEQQSQVEAYTAKLFEKINNSTFGLWLGDEQNNLQFKLGDILEKVDTDSGQSPIKNECDNQQKKPYKPLLESLFPECFVY